MVSGKVDKQLLEEIKGAYLLVQDDKIVLFNRKMAQLYGCRKGQHNSKFIKRTIVPEEQDRVLDIHSRRLTGQSMLERYETVSLTKDNTRLPIEVTAWLTQYQGRPAVSIVSLDISERNNHQNQIIRAQEEERKRLAQALHDDTIQELLLIMHRLKDVSDGTHGQLPNNAKESLTEIYLLVEKTMIEIKKFAEDLRPDILDDMGLVSALRWLMDRLSSGEGIKAEMHVLGEERRISSENELAIFRIAQEALSNVRKHASATKVILILKFEEKKVAITISDDGTGFETPAMSNHFTKQRKLGLVGISERVRLLDGKYNIKSTPGKGTVIRVEISG